MSEHLETARLLLRRPSLADAEAIYEFGSDPEVTRFMDWPTHRSRRDAEEFLAGCDQRWDLGELYWVIAVKPEPRVIGGISCRLHAGTAEIGYVLSRRFWGAGYATEAAGTVIGQAASLGCSRLRATCDIENLASRRVLEKAGLSLEAILPRYALRPNLSTERRDLCVYTATLPWETSAIAERRGRAAGAPDD